MRNEKGKTSIPGLDEMLSGGMSKRNIVPVSNVLGRVR